MKSTMSTKAQDEATLPKRNPKTGRFEKSTATPAKTVKPAAKKTKKS